MNCQEVDGMIIDLARGVEMDAVGLAHVRECGRCGARMAEEERLSAGLSAWAKTSAGEQAPSGVEENLLQAFRRESAPVGSRRKWLPFAAAGSIAASVLLFKLFTAASPVGPVITIPDTPRTVANVPAEAAPVAPPKARIRRVPRRAVPVLDPEPAPAPEEAHFLPVMQGDGWTPLDGGRVVRVQLPRSALLVFGLPMNEERALEQVQADVMLSNDGLLRAIRFVQ
jgi:hypothetical protein